MTDLARKIRDYILTNRISSFTRSFFRKYIWAAKVATDEVLNQAYLRLATCYMIRPDGKVRYEVNPYVVETR